jgi:zinc and cadmium transporter
MDVMLWALIGFMALFVLERFAPFHAHEHGAGGDCGGGSCGHVAHTCDHEHDHAPHAHADAHTHAPRLGWMGALLGLTVHSLMEGVALAASVQAESSAGWLAGLGTLLVIVAHKPFDAMTLAALLRQDRVDAGKAVVIQVLFSLVMPLGAFLFMAGVRHDPQVTALALAFSGGVFLCIACSDLLPEVQFHRHDRLKLTAALVGGILLAWGMSRLEATLHDHGDHDHGAASSHEGHDHGAPASSTDGHDHGSHDGHDH